MAILRIQVSQEILPLSFLINKQSWNNYITFTYLLITFTYLLDHQAPLDIHDLSLSREILINRLN